MVAWRAGIYDRNERKKIDQTTVETHHGKHHATYTKNFNDLVEKAGLTGKTAEEILRLMFGSMLTILSTRI